MMKKVVLVPSNRFWCRNDGTVEYNQTLIGTDEGQWSLLHEIAHSIHGHRGDVDETTNLRQEEQAWDWVKMALVKTGREDEVEHCSRYAEQCLESYRAHLKKVSQCPACGGTETTEWSPGSWTCSSCYCDW